MKLLIAFVITFSSFTNVHSAKLDKDDVIIIKMLDMNEYFDEKSQTILIKNFQKSIRKPQETKKGK